MKSSRIARGAIWLGLAALLPAQLYSLEIIKYNGDIAYLSLSKDSANRIIFPSDVVTKVYSKEKGVNIIEKGKEIYVKWTPLITTTTEVDESGQATPASAPKIDYTKAKVIDLFVTTENGTYSLVLNPASIPQETVVISNPAEDQKKSIVYETKDPYVDTMKKLVDLGFDLATETPNEDMQNFKIEKASMEDAIAINDRVDASLKAKMVGALFTVYLYEVKNKTPKALTLLESEFNRLPVKKKLGISLYSNEFFPFQRNALIVVARNTTSEKGD